MGNDNEMKDFFVKGLELIVEEKDYARFDGSVLTIGLEDLAKNFDHNVDLFISSNSYSYEIIGFDKRNNTWKEWYLDEMGGNCAISAMNIINCNVNENTAIGLADDTALYVGNGGSNDVTSLVVVAREAGVKVKWVEELD